jgi:hypothetical protein
MRGALAWALTTFQPEAPFELTGTDGTTRAYATSADVVRAVKEGELAVTPTFHVEAKLRPLAFLQDRPRGMLPEYAALKLTRLSKLPSADRERVRRGAEPALFYLAKNKAKYGLDQENAIDLNSLVRVHRSFVVTRPVGYLDDIEIDDLGRRLATFLDVDLEPAIREGVIRRWEQLVAHQQAQRKKP